jgi:hypothetical protein
VFQDVLTSVSRINKKYATTGERVAVIKRLFGDRIPVNLARRWADAQSIPEMKKAWLDHVKGDTPFTAHERNLEAQVRESEGQILQIEREWDLDRVQPRVEALDNLARQAQSRYSRAKDVAEMKAAKADWEKITQERMTLSAEAAKKLRESRDLRLSAEAKRRKLAKLIENRDGIPIYEIPHISAVKHIIYGENVRGLKRGITGTGMTASARFMEALATPMRKVVRYNIDELGNRPVVYSPDGGPAVSADWAEQNSYNVEKFLERAGVPIDERNVLIGQMLEAETRDKFYAWARDAQKTIGDYLPSNVPDEVRHALTNWFDSAIESKGRNTFRRRSKLANGQTIETVEPIVGKKIPGQAALLPRPSSPTDLLGNFRLPDVNLAISATSVIENFWRRTRKIPLPKAIVKRGMEGREGSGAFNPLEESVRAVEWTLKAGTTLLKAPILVLRLPSMIARIQLEQGFRAHIYGDYRGVVFFPGGIPMSEARNLGIGRSSLDTARIIGDGKYAGYRHPRDMSLGTIAEQILGDQRSMEYRQLDTSLINAGRQRPGKHHYIGAVEALTKLHKDWFDRQFVAKGLDIDAMLEKIANDPKFADYVNDVQLPILRDAWVGEMGVIEMPIETLERLVAFPERLTGAARTIEQTQALQTSIRDRGYQPGEVDPVTGIEPGYIVIKWDPRIQRAIIDEHTHTIGALRSAGYDTVPVKIEQADLSGYSTVVSPSGRAPIPLTREAREIRVRELEQWLAITDTQALGEARFAEIEAARVDPGNPKLSRAAHDAQQEILGVARDRKEFAELTGQEYQMGAAPGTSVTTAGLVEMGTDAWHSDMQTKQLTDVEAVRRWLSNKRESILDQTNGGDPAYLKAIRDGRFRTRTSRVLPELDDLHPASGTPLWAHYESLFSEHRAAADRVRLAVREGDSSTIYQMQRQKVNLEQEMRAIERKLGLTDQDILRHAKDSRAIPLDNLREASGYVRSQFQQGKYQFPGSVDAKQRYSWEDMNGPIEAIRMVRDGWNGFWYGGFKPATFADMNGTRGSLFLQLAEQYYKDLTKRGYSREKALTLAEVKAATETRDLMYDLSGRTSMQRTLRDVFWFAPAAQEVAWTWLVKLPMEQAFGTGYLTTALKVRAMYNVLNAVGLVDTNEQGEAVIKIPGFENAFGFPAEFKVRGFNLVLSQPIPSLNTMGAAALGKMSREYGGVFKDLSDFFNHYGADISFTPTALRYAWEATTGAAFPLEFLAPDYQRAQIDRAYDLGLQWAFADRILAGNLPPQPTDYPDRENYEAARDAYLEELLEDGEHYHKSMAFVKLLGSIGAPASVYPYRDEQRRWRQYWSSVIDPAGNEEETGTYSERQKELIDKYIGRHPESLAYSVGYTVFGDKDRELAYMPKEDEEFWDQLYTGERRILTPEEFAQRLMLVESYRFLNSRRQHALDKVGTTAGELLRHGFEKASVLADYSEDWNRWLAYNPEAKTLWEASRRSWEERYGIPANSYETERLAIAVQKLNELSPLFTGENGMRSPEYRTIMFELKQALSETGIYGEPTTQVGKDMVWYYDNVLDPYFDETETLYNRAAELSSTGQDASAVYNEIRAVNERMWADPPVLNGEAMPTPEEVFFGNKRPEEQEYAVRAWATRPPQWLTSFQMDQVGIFEEFEGRDVMLDEINKVTDMGYDAIYDNNFTSSSKEYEHVINWIENQKKDIAFKYGVFGDRLLTQINATPIERINETGYGSDSQLWQQFSSNAKLISNALVKNDLSLKGFSEQAWEGKLYLYRSIEAARVGDEDLDKLWDTLANSVPAEDGSFRQGVTLYDAVLFGNYGGFIPPAFIREVYA